MTRPASLTRRSALAGAALLVGDLGASVARPAEAGAGPDTCCGKGPPDTALYGTGIHPILPTGAANSAIVFENPLWADGLDGQYYYMFVPDIDVRVTEYLDPDGGSHKPKHYIIPDYDGIIYRIEPGFTLGLQWPDGITPDFSTRALGRKEGGNA